MVNRSGNPDGLDCSTRNTPSESRLCLDNIRPRPVSDVKICIAIVALTTLELVALSKGKNGTLLRIIIIAIAGLAGFSIAELVK